MDNDPVRARERLRQMESTGKGPDAEKEPRVRKIIEEPKADPALPDSTKAGGRYIPPARLAMMRQSITDKSSKEYQRLSWEALKKSINGLINKVFLVLILEIFFEVLFISLRDPKEAFLAPLVLALPVLFRLTWRTQRISSQNSFLKTWFEAVVCLLAPS
jgi:hypothetical protein